MSTHGGSPMINVERTAISNDIDYDERGEGVTIPADYSNLINAHADNSNGKKRKNDRACHSLAYLSILNTYAILVAFNLT